MKFSIIILLIGCIINNITCDEDKIADCKWTGCAGNGYSGKETCNTYGYGKYTGNYKKDDCGWDSSKVECCKLIKSKPECKWAKYCYRSGKSDSSVCTKEFGEGYEPSKRKYKCPNAYGVKYTRECCPSKA